MSDEKKKSKDVPPSGTADTASPEPVEESAADFDARFSESAVLNLYAKNGEPTPLYCVPLRKSPDGRVYACELLRPFRLYERGDQEKGALHQAGTRFLLWVPSSPEARGVIDAALRGGHPIRYDAPRMVPVFHKGQNKKIPMWQPDVRIDWSSRVRAVGLDQIIMPALPPRKEEAAEEDIPF